MSKVFSLRTSIYPSIDDQFVYFKGGFLFSFLCLYENQIQSFVHLINFPGIIIRNSNLGTFKILYIGPHLPFILIEAKFSDYGFRFGGLRPIASRWDSMYTYKSKALNIIFRNFHLLLHHPAN